MRCFCGTGTSSSSSSSSMPSLFSTTNVFGGGWFVILLSFILSSNHIVQVDAKENICFILYQMADNNLEEAIRQDNNELIQSSFIRDTTVTTWVYFDGRNYNTPNLPDVTEPLMDIYNADGTTVMTKYEGSRYFTYNHDMEKMIIDTTLEGERNGDDPQTVYDFVFRALTDCVAKGSTEYFMGFSSHGTGIGGYGGDDNIARRRLHGRKLVQPNNQIVLALSTALQDVEGGPTMFDMIGFDACLMSSFEALDDYQVLTKYYLASEPTEPGHGWSYNKLTPQESIVDLGKQIIDSFIDEKQGGFWHQTPKQLALIDVNQWKTFVAAWEALSGEFLTLLESGSEGLFRESLQRARGESLGVDSGYLDTDPKYPGNLDIGDFLLTFQDLCNPPSGGDLPTLLDDALTAYNDMFILRRTGARTPNLTGMYVLWPRKAAYQADPYLLDDLFLNETSTWYNNHSPMYNDLMDAYLKVLPSALEPGAACTCDAPETTIVRDDIPEDDAEALSKILMLDPTLFDLSGGLQVKSQLASTADFVFVEYGVEVSHLFSEYFDIAEDGKRHRRRRSRRQLMPQVLQGGQKQEGQSQPTDKGAALPSSSSTTDSKRASHRSLDRRRPHQQAKRMKRQENPNHRRHLQESSSHFLLFGGDVSVSYTCSGMSGTWNRDFYYLEGSDGWVEMIYAYDQGQGSKSVPVYYFAELDASSATSIQEDLLSLEDMEAMGGIYGTLEFSVDPETGEPEGNLSLFTVDPEFGASETPFSAGGYIVPVVYVEALFPDGSELDVLPGGFSGTVLEWKSDSGYELRVGDTKGFFFETLNVTAAVVDMVAYDFDLYLAEDAGDNDGIDFYYFELGEYELTEDPTKPDSGAASMRSILFSSICSVISVALLLAASGL